MLEPVRQSLLREWPEGSEEAGTFRELVGKGSVAQGLTSCRQDFGFYSEWDGRQCRFNQRSELMPLAF